MAEGSDSPKNKKKSLEEQNLDELLFHFCLDGDIENFSLLLSMGANSNARRSSPAGNGVSILHIACHKGRKEFVSALLDHKADVNILTDQKDAPIHAACFMNRPDCLRLLLEYGANVDQMNQMSETPLYLACILDHPECVSLLLDKDADPNIADLHGQTPLYSALFTGRTRCVSLLLQHTNVSPNFFSNSSLDETPLHLACVMERKDCVALLFEHNVDPDTLDRGILQRTNRSLAYEECLQMVEEYKSR